MLSRWVHRSLSHMNRQRRQIHNERNQRTLADQTTPLPLVIPTSGVPIHVYTRELEAQALKQLIVLAESGIVKGFVAAMADVHVGKRDE